MMMKKLAALMLVLPMTLVSLKGFAGDETEEKKEDGDKSEMMVELQVLLADEEQDQDSTDDEAPVEGSKRAELLSENDTDEVPADEDSEKKDG